VQTDPNTAAECTVVHATTGESDDVRVVRLVKGGPMLVEGPVRIVAEDGTETESDRFMVAVCRCRRSAVYPLCDTSHRRPGPPRR
jgi:hypothetical protein